MFFKFVSCFFALAIVNMFAHGLDICRGEDNGPTARGMFMLLPTTIFESAPEGLSEAAKEDLLAEGRSEYWEITDESPSSIIFSSLPFYDRQIGLFIFPNNQKGGAVAAYGVMGDQSCALELWSVDPAGRILPEPEPAEPEAWEFFGKKKKMDKNNKFSPMICLENGRLVGKLMGWKDDRLINLMPEKEIVYEWNGSEFEKSEQK